MRHNELCDGVAYLAGIAFIPSHMRNNPLIFAGCAVKRSKAKEARTKSTTVPSDMSRIESTEHKGDLLIREL